MTQKGMWVGGWDSASPWGAQAGTLCEVMSIKDLTWETGEQAGHSEGQGEGPCLRVRKELTAGAEKGAWVRVEMFSETEHPPAKCLILGLWLPPSPELCGWEVGSGSGGLSPPYPPEGTYPLQLHLHGPRTLSPKPVSTRGPGWDQAF